LKPDNSAIVIGGGLRQTVAIRATGEARWFTTGERDCIFLPLAWASTP